MIGVDSEAIADAERSISACLYSYRHRMGLTTIQAARLVGVSRSTFWRWESNQVEIPRPALKLMALYETQVRAQRKQTNKEKGNSK